MAAERLTMHQIREILRHHHQLQRSQRDIQAALGVSKGVVSKVLVRAARLGLGWDTAQGLSDAELAARIYGAANPAGATRAVPDWRQVHAELRKPGVTLELLHLEFRERHPDSYRYSKFCALYREWAQRLKPTMRQVHVAGDRMFVDYAGKKPHIVDPETGQCQDVELFAAVLGASNYTYVEATLTQRGPDFIQSHVNAFRFFGGVTAAVVPDQLKSAVVTSCHYEPGIQRTYEEMARHYGTAVFPARPKHPRDKAKVEVGVQVVERWVVARLRNEVFYSLADLNTRIHELLEELNNRPMRTYGKSRRQLFQELDQPALRPLPATPFEYGEWLKARVNIDYHVEVDHHLYSVPYALIHQQVDVRLTLSTVEVFHKGARVTSHVRSRKRGRSTTVPEHMPSSHRAHAEWTPERIRHWAGSIGPRAQQMVDAIMASRPYPEQGFRACLGILRLAKSYGPERLEAACTRALSVGAHSYQHVHATLKNGLDRTPLPDDGSPNQSPLFHANVRGSGYYH